MNEVLFYMALNERIDRVGSELAKLAVRPAEKPFIGTIRMHKRGKRKFWSREFRDDDGRRREKYLSKEEISKLPSWISYICKYEMELLLKAELNMLLRLNNKDFCHRIEKLKASFTKRYGDLVPEDVWDIRTQGKMWQAQEYHDLKMDDEEDEALWESLRGDMHRSKLELIVADQIYSMNYYYRTEEEVYMPSIGRNRYPDFTVVSPITGKKVYVEVFGMMDNEEYAKKNYKKINIYARNGIIIGMNFLPVFEYPGVPFDTAAFRVSLQALLDR